jgi:hypothetical protein
MDRMVDTVAVINTLVQDRRIYWVFPRSLISINTSNTSNNRLWRDLVYLRERTD